MTPAGIEPAIFRFVAQHLNHCATGMTPAEIEPATFRFVAQHLNHCATGMTPAGIEPATFRFVAQHLNHCATGVPLFQHGSRPNITVTRYLRFTLGSSVQSTWSFMLDYVLSFTTLSITVITVHVMNAHGLRHYKKTRGQLPAPPNLAHWKEPPIRI